MKRAAQAQQTGNARPTAAGKGKKYAPFKSTPKTSSNLTHAKARVDELSKAQAEAEKKRKEAAANVRTTVFTYDQLKIAWEEFASSDQVADSPVMKTIVTNCPYELSGSHIQLHLSNTVQEGLMNKLKPKLLSFLRQALKNDVIEIHAEIRQQSQHQQNNSKKLYTDADKLKHLMEEYPLFAELKNSLGLDLSN